MFHVLEGKGEVTESDMTSPFKKIVLGCEENGLRCLRGNIATDEARAGGGDGKRRVESRYIGGRMTSLAEGLALGVRKGLG